LIEPYRFFQSYDLRDENHVISLVRYLSRELDLDVPVNSNVAEFTQEIRRLNKALSRSFLSFDELKSAEEFRGALADIDNPIEVPINEIEIWDERELRIRVFDGRVIELNGYTTDSMGFYAHHIEVPKGCGYLLVYFENAENAESRSFDKLLKLIIDRQTVKAMIKEQVHHHDSQYIIKGDGFFIYELPFSVKHAGKIHSLNFVFWRLELKDVVMRLYLT